MTPILLAATLVAASVSSAFIALLLLSGLLAGRKRAPDNIGTRTVEPTVFLFDDRDLIDATPPARLLLDRIGGPGRDWDRLAGFLSNKIPGFLDSLSDLSERGEVQLNGADDPGFSVHAEYIRGVARLTLTDLGTEGQGIVVDGLSLQAQEEEIAALREVLAAIPHPVWRTAPSGSIAWANDRYLALLADATDDETLTWPLPALFDLPPAAEETGLPKRVSLKAGDGRSAHWFDCHTLPSATGTINFALAADPLVKAETALRNFVQTLTRTFAHLPIGLAIFDRDRQLALFNPALMELTSLDAEFLSARPTLFSFLDRLREARIIPEPKDYSSWRQKMMNLEKAATSGHYEETWSLTTGQTYRVTGRPHHDGAVAFFIEDITAEISLTRRFRSEIETGQSVIDTLDEAVVVFGANGDLLMSNAAYAKLWQVDPATTLGQMTIIDATMHWQTMALPNRAWGDLRDFVGQPGDRCEWDADVQMADGYHLTAHITPMSAGATLVRFQAAAADRLFVHRSRRTRTEEADSRATYLDA